MKNHITTVTAKMRTNIIQSCLIFIFLILSGTAKCQQKSNYGGVFTPKGNLKALIVPVIFKDAPSTNLSFKNKNHFLQGWTLIDSSKLPDVVNPISGDCPNWMYNRPEHFETMQDQVFINDSKLFYFESNHQFRLMAEFFKDSSGRPAVIEIDPDGGKAWSHMNYKAFEEMKRINPGFDFKDFDTRINRPNYKFDNSLNPQADSIVDYIIFIYRFSPSWSQFPAIGMNGWLGSGGGYASPSGIQMEKFNGYSFSEGFTMMWGSGVFVHELAHTLFNSPHVFGANGTVGAYFYRPSISWGTMSTIPIFYGFNSWESWYMGYNEILHDINNEKDLEQGNEFVLNDFYSSRDVLRVKIPFSGGQHLWIEHHAKQHPYDEHIWKGYVIDKDTIAETPAGTYMYVESIAADRGNIIEALSDICNGLKPLNASGNYDYTYLDEAAEKNAWGNKLYKFRRQRENPISGTNPYLFYRADFDKDGTIAFDGNTNGAKNECEPINRIEVTDGIFKNFYHNFGVYNEKDREFSRTPAFQPGDLLDMGSNPALTNYQRYLTKKANMEPIFLNGLKIELLKGTDKHSIKVKVKFKQTELRNDVRWTGNIVLPDITQDSFPDLIINKRVDLLLDKSGTVNRHTKTEDGDFINPTLFKIQKGAMLYMKKGSRLIVDKDTVLELEKGSRFKMEKKAKLIIKPGGKLILNTVEIEKNTKSYVVIQ